MPGWWALGYGVTTANNLKGISGFKSAVGLPDHARKIRTRREEYRYTPIPPKIIIDEAESASKTNSMFSVKIV